MLEGPPPGLGSKGAANLNASRAMPMIISERGGEELVSALLQRSPSTSLRSSKVFYSRCGAEKLSYLFLVMIDCVGVSHLHFSGRAGVLL